MAPKSKKGGEKPAAAAAAAPAKTAPAKSAPAPVKSSKPQNSLLAKGLYRLSAGTNSRLKGRFKGPKGGNKKEVVASSTGKSPRFYPADDLKIPLKRAFKPKIAKMRASITPGTVLIVLSGRFRGKRVVFLKQLEKSGTLLVTGPFKVNGVPIRRVNQAYVIATSVKVDVSSVDVSSISDDFFAKEVAEKKSSEDQFFTTEQKAGQVSEEKKKAQKEVDAPLLKAIEGVPMLKAYLSAKFSLSSKDRPHEMLF